MVSGRACRVRRRTRGCSTCTRWTTKTCWERCGAVRAVALSCHSHRHTSPLQAADASLLLSPDSLGGGEEQLPRIRVVVRKRPLNTRERGRREEDVVVVRGPSLTVHEPRTKVDLTRYTECHSFTFDDVLEETASNDQVYALAVEPLVATVFRRGRATCFAYGQTGSGKTHTMQPLPVRTARQMLETLASHAAFSGLRLGLSYFEIYGGRVFDLLSERRKLCIRESGAGEIVVVGLREHPVSDVATVQQLIERGLSARSTGSTGANADSSRSHAILQLTLRRRLRGDSGAPTEEGGPVALGRLHGRFSFIDLAGSERGADTTDNDRQTRLEGAEINKSLLALKECIRALDQDRAQGGAGRHIPFRGSKLTEVLRDSFGGDGRTVMVANISPASGSCEHTLNTLRYADRVKELRRGEESAARVSPERRPVSRSVGVRASLQRPVSRSLPQRPSTAGAAVARSPPLAVAAPPPPSPSLRRSVTSQDALDEEDALLAAAHEELMHTILEEEEVIIAAHRRQIEVRASGPASHAPFLTRS